MKILVINGSPRGARGNTDTLVQAFLQGARDAGAESEIVYLCEKHIEHCDGCFTCWLKTPGECIHKDDMADVMMKLPEADMVVYAVPLYVYSVPGLMKDFFDRLLPLAQPYIDVENGVSNHPLRYGAMRGGQVVVISNSGFPEQAHFAGLKETFRCWIRGGNRTFSGMICCAGGVMLQITELKGMHHWYLDAVRQAGRQLVEQGAIAQHTQSILDTPLVSDPEHFAEMANAEFSRMGIPRV